MSLIFTKIPWHTHTCILRETFMDHATRTIHLDNIGVLYNTKSAIYDMTDIGVL